MLTTLSQERAQAAAIDRVTVYMRRRRLVLADLLAYGGEDFPNPKIPDKVCDPKRVEMAHRVGGTWALMAATGVSFAMLEVVL